MIFDAYVWAQLELQLSVICASLPALRVFLRRYLAGPFSRANHSGFSFQRSQRSNNEDVKRYDISGPIMIDPMADDFDLKHKMRKPSTIEETTVAGSEWEMRSRSPSAPSEARILKGPYTSESYNMDVIEDYERSVHSPSFERAKSSRGRNNFSQPFPINGTFFDDRG
jgi:hypothetical protein